MHKSRIFLLILLFFISGIACGSVFSLPISLIYFCSVITVILISLWYKNRKATLVVFLFIAFFTGFIHVKVEISSFDHLRPDGSYLGKGLITSIETKKSANQVIVKTENLPKKILINISELKEFIIGSVVSVECDLQLPTSIEDFDYRMYLAKEGVGYICKKPKIISNRKIK